MHERMHFALVVARKLHRGRACTTLSHLPHIRSPTLLSSSERLQESRGSGPSLVLDMAKGTRRNEAAVSEYEHSRDQNVQRNKVGGEVEWMMTYR